MPKTISVKRNRVEPQGIRKRATLGAFADPTWLRFTLSERTEREDRNRRERDHAAGEFGFCNVHPVGVGIVPDGIRGQHHRYRF